MNHTEGSELEPSEVLFSRRSSSPILISSVPSSIRLSNTRQSPTTAQLAELFNLTDPDISREQLIHERGNYQRPSSYRLPSLYPGGNQTVAVTLANVPGNPIAVVFSSRTQRPLCTNRTTAVNRSLPRGEPNRFQRASNQARLSSREGSSNFVGPYLPRYPLRQAHRVNGGNTRVVYPAYFIHQHTNPFVRRSYLSPAVVMPRDYYSNDDLIFEDVSGLHGSTSSGWMYHPAYTPVLTAAAAFAFGTAAAIVSSSQSSSGLPDAAIASIPRRRGSVTTDDNGEGKECPICLDVCKDEWCKKLPLCGHEFHAGCLDRWLLQKNNCPVCRRVAFVFN